MIRSALISLLLAIGSGTGLVQTAAGQNPFIMNLDYARFRNDPATDYLEVYYSFYCGQLTFNKEGRRQRGAISLSTDIMREETGEYVVRENTTLPVVVGDTASSMGLKTVVCQAGHILPFGKYRLQVVAYDSLNPAMRDSLALPLELKEFSSIPAISDLELCSSIKRSQNRGDAFYKNSYETVPNPTLVFGREYPVIYVYCELYSVDTTTAYSLVYAIVDDYGTVVEKITRKREYKARYTVEIGTVNAVSLKSGKYTLRLSLQDPRNGETDAVRKSFFINNPGTAQSRSMPDPRALSSAIEALTPEEVEREFQQVRYLATESEMYLFDQLKGSQPQGRFLQDFWNRVEAGRDGHVAVRRADFLQKVKAANERFAYLGKAGWKTDMGRVFIVYGPPDNIERHASERETKPFEIWSYYQIESGVQFIFVDWTGYGDFQLVHSTKRGEVQDEDWGRYLR